MAQDNKIVISAELRELTEKQVNKFATQLTKSITKALTSVSVDFSKVQITNVDKLATKVANQFAPAFNKALGEVNVNASKLKKFAVPVKLDLTAAKKQLEEFAKTNTLTVVTALTSPKTAETKVTAGTTDETLPRPTLDQKSIDAATAALKSYRSALLANGATQKEADKQTNSYAATIRGLQSSLNNANRIVQVSGKLSDKQTERLQVQRLAAEDLVKTINRLGTAHAMANIEVRRGEAFLESFGFRVGILGFGFGILGGHLQRFSQGLIQLGTNAARVIEPLERVRNALMQDPSRSAEQQQTVFAELARLADLPGSNLETVVKSFRSLASLKLGDETSLAFIEGLTKVTAIAGSGAEGLGRLIDQFRQFQLSGVLTKRDVRTIVEQGGGPIANALQAAFGTTDSKALQTIGAENVIKGLVEQLQKIPTPLETATDKFNRLTNALTRMQLVLAPLIKPGLDNLVSILKALLPIVDKLSQAFASLPQGLQNAISTLLVLSPLIAGLVAGIFTLISALGIGIAAFKQVGDALRDTRGLLLGTEETVGKLTGTVKAAGSELTIFGAISAKITKPLGNIAAFFSLLFTEGPQAFKLLNLSIGGTVAGLVKFLGLTTPIGIIVNLILALFTNAAHSRDVLFEAFSSLGDAVSDLGKEFKKLTGIEFWDVAKVALKAILTTVELIIGAIGGALVSGLTTVVLFIRDIVVQVTDLLKLIRDPSWNNLQDFFGSLLNTLIRLTTTFGTLLAAVLLDVLGEALQEFAVTKDIGSGLSKHAENLRKSLNLAGQEGTKSTNNVTTSVKTLTSALTEADETTQKLIDSFNDLTLAKLKQDTALFRAQERFENEQRRRAAEFELDRRIKADPAAALPTIRPTLEGVAQQTRSELQSQTSDTLRQRYNELRVVVERLNPELTNLLTRFSGLEILQKKTKPLDNWVAALNQLSIFIASGKTDLAEFTRLYDNLIAVSKPAIQDNLFRLKDEDKDRLVDLYQELSKGLISFREELVRSNSEQQRATEQIETQIQAKERETKVQIDQNKALEENFDKKERIAAIDREIQNLEMQRGSLPFTKAAALQERINKLIEERNDLESKYTTAIRVEADKNAEIQQKQADIQKNVASAYAATIARIQLQIEANEKLRASLEQGFAEADRLFDKFKEIDAQRVELGLAPGVVQLPSSIGARVEAEIAPLQQQTSELMERTSLTGVEGRFTHFINLLKQGSILTEEFRKELFLMGQAAEQGLNNVTNEIIAADQAVEKARIAFAQTTEGTQGRRDAQATLQLQLDKQTKLNATATIHFNRLKSINAILNANTSAVDEQLRKRQQLNQATLITLRQVEQELELNLELIQLQLDNANKPGGVSLTPGGIIQTENDLIQRQIDLLEKRFQIRVAEIEAEKIAAKAKLDSGVFKTKEEYEAEIARLNELLRLLKAIKDEQQKGLENEKDPTSGIPGAGTFAKGLDKYFDSITSSISKSTTALQQWFEKLVSGKQFVDAFIGYLDGAITKSKAFQVIVSTAVAALGSALASALISTITEGESFAKAFTRFLGQILVSIGTLLIQVGTAALIAGVLSKFFPFLMPILNPTGIGEGAAVAAIAIGTGMVALGAIMGAAASSGASAASTNTANSADSATGAQRNTFEPNKDPRFIFQKTMLATIKLEIKTDDSQIIKAVINGVNQNGRLTRLIGNRKLEFTV